jgi:hypothetical protein
MSQRVETSARALVLTRSFQPENGHLRKNIKLLTFHLRTPICIKHTPKWQKNINKYKKCMLSYLLHIIDITV